MEGWEVAVLIIFLIILTAAIIVTIYFVWRWEEDKKNTNTNPPPPNGQTGTTGATGTTGMTGTFSISPAAAPSMFMTYDPNNPISNPGNSNTVFPVVTTNGTALRCADYQWSTFPITGVPSVLALRNPTIIQSGQTRPQFLDAATPTLTGPAGLASITDIPLLGNWTYTSDKKWCSQGVFCLYYNSDNTVTIENINNVNLTLSNFVWNNSPSPPSTCIT